MRSFAQDVSNFARTNDPMRWFHYRGQKAREKDKRKYFSFFVHKTPHKNCAIKWRKPRWGKNEQKNLSSLHFLSPPLMLTLQHCCQLSRERLNLPKLIWNSCHIKKVHKSVREGICETARVAAHGKKVHV